jgi:hypothetical protein
LQPEYDELQDDWGEAYDRAQHEGLLSSFDPSGFNRASGILMTEIKALESEADNLREEVAVIEVVLDKKWK